MKVKYYYSAPQQIRLGYFLADCGGNPIYQFADSKFIKNLPRVTICSLLDGDKLSFGFTTCSSKDQYNKKIGQHISYIRAMKKPYKVVTLSDMKTIHEISNTIIEEIYTLETNRIFHVSD